MKRPRIQVLRRRRVMRRVGNAAAQMTRSFRTTKGAVRETPVSGGYLAKERKRGQGPAYYAFGSRYFYRPDDVEKYVESKRVDPTGRRLATKPADVCPTCGRRR